MSVCWDHEPIGALVLLLHDVPAVELAGGGVHGHMVVYYHSQDTDLVFLDSTRGPCAAGEEAPKAADAVPGRLKAALLTLNPSSTLAEPRLLGVAVAAKTERADAKRSKL